MKTSSQSKVLDSLGLSSREARRKYEKIVLYYKIVRGIYPQYLTFYNPAINTDWPRDNGEVM